MNIWLKFGSLYLIPIVSFVFTVGVYFYAYGKAQSQAREIVDFVFIIIVIGFIASSYIAAVLIMHYFSSNAYIGIVFSVLAWILNLIVIGLYLMFLYNKWNP